MIRRAPNRATSSRTSLSSRPEPNNTSISPRIFSVGDTGDGAGVVLPAQTLAVLYGTYARRHLHRRMDRPPGAVRTPARTPSRHAARQTVDHRPDVERRSVRAMPEDPRHRW